jgi:hypothetical protein
MIGSNDRPAIFVIGNSKAIINYGITETETGYAYETMEYPATDLVVLERARAKLERQHANKVKLANIEKIIITSGLVGFDAHTRARSDITGVVALASYEFNKALVTLMPELQPVYDAVYGSSVEWKGADNLVHSVLVEDVAEVGISAMREYAKVIGI